jgi:hypothetical protein
MSFLMTACHSTLYEPVTAEVVAILDDLVPLLRSLLFRRPGKVPFILVRKVRKKE